MWPMFAQRVVFLHAERHAHERLSPFSTSEIEEFTTLPSGRCCSVLSPLHLEAG